MKSWKRTTLLIIALSLFFVVAPALVFYATGYRYDFNNKAFRKIGMIIVESEPKNASISINDKYRANTPSRIKNLLPGEYSVKVTKDNFNSWGKKLTVESKKVTWAANIKLFYQNPIANKLTNFQIEDFNLAPNSKEAIIFSKQEDKSELYLINLETKETKKILDTNTQNTLLNIEDSKNINFSNFKWSPDSKKLILSRDKKNTSNLLVINLQETNNSFSFNDFYDLDAEKAEWKNENEIYLLDKSKNLHLIPLNSQLEPSTLLNNIIDFDYNKNEGLIYLKEENENLKLLSENTTTENPIMHLAKEEKYKIKSGSKNNIAVLSLNKKKLYLVNKETKKPLTIGENIDNFEWSSKENKLLYFNKNEVWFYVPEKEESDLNRLAYKYNEANLLTRYSTDIQNATWYTNEEYLTVLLSDSIKIIELDGRDKRNCYELKQNLKSNSKKIEFNKNGEKIYYLNGTNNFTELIITED